MIIHEDEKGKRENDFKVEHDWVNPEEHEPGGTLLRVLVSLQSIHDWTNPQSIKTRGVSFFLQGILNMMHLPEQEQGR